jgi:hypothetical protein
VSEASADERPDGIPDERHCAEYQADGVPCETVGGACAECERAMPAGEVGTDRGPQGEGREAS